MAFMGGRSARRNRPLIFLSVLLVGLVVAIALGAALLIALLPAGDQMAVESRRLAAGVIFVGSYLALAIGRIPGLSIDRAGIALVGASLMVASGALSLDDAYKAVDLDTLTLLLGMMIVVASLRLSGFFGIANAWVGIHARRPVVLLAAVVFISGIFSALYLCFFFCICLHLDRPALFIPRFYDFCNAAIHTIHTRIINNANCMLV